MRVEIKGYAGETIQSFSDRGKYALPPERKYHWKEGRSEFELGRAWTANGEPAPPCELVELLESNEGTKGIVISSGRTQHETPLAFSNRGPRCHDLALLARQNQSVISISIEAKADESFGDTVVRELDKAKRRSPQTKFPERLDWLTRSLLGIPAFGDDARFVLSDSVSSLPYQLLSAIGGTLREAELQSSSAAVFLVHEFRTAATDDRKIEANAEALTKFLQLLLSANVGPSMELHGDQDWIIGPISIPERPASGAFRLPCDIPLFVGKIRTDRLTNRYVANSS